MAAQPRPARGAAPAGLPPALRHPADQPVRRWGVPGEPGRGRAVQPGERRRPGRDRQRVRRAAAAVLAHRAVRRRAAGPLAAAAGAALVERAALPAGRRRRDRDRDPGRGRAVLRDRAAGHLGQPVLPGRAVGRPAARRRAGAAGHRQRAEHDQRLGRDRGRPRGRGAAAAGRRQRRRRVRADRADLDPRLRLVGVPGPPVRAGPARAGRRAALAPGDRARRRPRAGRRRPARGRAARGRLGAGRDRRAPVLLRDLDDLDPAALPELLHRRRRSSRPGWPGSGRSSPPPRPAR